MVGKLALLQSSRDCSAYIMRGGGVLVTKDSGLQVRTWLTVSGA